MNLKVTFKHKQHKDINLKTTTIISKDDTTYQDIYDERTFDRVFNKEQKSFLGMLVYDVQRIMNDDYITKDIMSINFDKMYHSLKTSFNEDVDREDIENDYSYFFEVFKDYEITTKFERSVE